MAKVLTDSYQYIARSSLQYPRDYTSAGYRILLYAKTSANIETGKHTVSVMGRIVSTSANMTYYSFASTTTGKINKSTAFTTSKKPSSAWADSGELEAGIYTYPAFAGLGSGSITVDCSDGNPKDIPVSITYKFGSSDKEFTPPAGTTMTVSSTVTLPAIVRAAEITSAPDFNDEEDPIIEYTNPGTAVPDLLQVCISFDGETPAISYRDIPVDANSYTFELTTDERNILRNGCTTSNSTPVYFMLSKTVGETTLVDTVAKTLTIINAEPEISWTSIEEVDTAVLNSTVANKGVFLKGISDIKLTVTPTLKKGATLASVAFKELNVSDSRPQPYNTNPTTINNIVTDSYSCTVTDSRGNQTTSSTDITLVDYVIPSITNLKIYRDTSSDPTQIYIDANLDYFNGNFTSNLANSVTISLKNAAGTIKNITGYTLSGNSIVIDNIDTGFDLAESSSDTYTLTITDKITSSSVSRKVSLLVPTFEMGQYDAQVNGDLFIANTDRTNPVNVLNEILDLHQQDISLAVTINNLLYPVGSVIINSERFRLPSTLTYQEGINYYLKNAEKGNYVKQAADTDYTIGETIPDSVYEEITPGEIYGGEWQLVHKNFKPGYGSSVTTLTPSNYLKDTSSAYVVRQGNVIRIRFDFDFNKSVGDTDVSLGTIDYKDLGILSLMYTATIFGYVTDDIWGMFYLNYSTGEMIWRGMLADSAVSSTSVEAGSAFWADYTFVVPQSYMLDDQCSEFFWKRIA